MRHLGDRRLDALTVAWVEAARDAGDEALAACAAELALVRFGILDDDGGEYWACRGKEMLEEWDRLDLDISPPDTTVLRDAIESRREFYEAMMRSVSEARI